MALERTGIKPEINNKRITRKSLKHEYSHQIFYIAMIKSFKSVYILSEFRSEWFDPKILMKITFMESQVVGVGRLTG
jgi:hypothetical protein